MIAKASGGGAPEPSVEEFDRLLSRIESGTHDAKDVEALRAIGHRYFDVRERIQNQQTSMSKLRQLIFGAPTESKEKVLERAESAGGATAAEVSTPTAPRSEAVASSPKTPAKGHGRNGAVAYTGAKRVVLAHPTLRSGSCCPDCKNKVYPRKEPRRIVRIEGMAPIGATVYEQEELRCSVCERVFTAPAPEGIGEAKYDATAVAMVALLRYGSGMPFFRIERLQEGMGVPLPSSTQWDLVEKAEEGLTPAFGELLRQAAQGQVLHNDDTPMVVLEYLAEEKARKERGEKASERTGVFTTGIVAVVGAHRLVLYRTGHRHAGENLREVLLAREAALPPAIQMCDALDRNLPGELQTVVANCLTHGRRQFVDVVEAFPNEVRHVIEELSIVYRTDAKTRGLPRAERLRIHREESAPVMERLRAWLEALAAGKTVEPNSGLGKAIAYMLKRWGRLTLFLREEGAPLDNNLCERMLKRAILHRKNSLFYKTENGARVGDLYMSLIATARLADADPFDYLVQLQRHTKRVRESPADWMPWNYKAAAESAERPKPGPAP